MNQKSPTLISRRSLLALTSVLAVAACADTPAAEPPAAESGTVTNDKVDITTRFGPSSVPRTPQRVISTYDTGSDFAHVLGLPLVAVGGSGPADRDLAEYQRALGLNDLPKLSTYPDIPIEAVLKLEPDLILDDFALDEPGFTKLSAVVPVYSFDVEPETVNWRTLLQQMATVFGAEEKVKGFVEAYDQRVADLKTRVQSRWAGAKFAYVGPYGNGTYYIAQANMTTNEVMHKDLGFAFAKAVPPTVATRQVDVSMEKLDELNDADLLLLRTNPKEDGTGVDEKQTASFQNSSLWRRLPAVKKGNDFLIPGALFYTSPLTPAANLDWVEANLLA